MNTDILFNTASGASNEPGFPTALPNPQGQKLLLAARVWVSDIHTLDSLEYPS